MQQPTNEQTIPPSYEVSELAKYGDFMALGANEYAKERLCSFLCYILSIEYKIKCHGELPKHEWCHWIRLARISKKMHTHVRWWDEATKEDAAWIEYFHHHVIQPSSALGIPVGYTLALLHLFPLTATLLGPHASILRRFSLRGLDCLATRLVIERELVIDVVASCPQRRAELMRVNEDLTAAYFTRLDGPDDYELSGFGRKFVDVWQGAWLRADEVRPPILQRTKASLVVKIKYYLRRGLSLRECR